MPLNSFSVSVSDVNFFLFCLEFDFGLPIKLNKQNISFDLNERLKEDAGKGLLRVINIQ